jgi:hypothetical protein
LPLTWLPGLYAPAKDVAKGAMSLRQCGVTLTIVAYAQGPRTRIIVTAQCRRGGKPILVRGCWAELYETAFDSCSGPQPVRTRVINFRPGGPVTIQPGELPVRWEAQVLNEHVRRAVRELDDAATIKTYGEKHGYEVLAQRDRCQRDGEALRKHHPLIGVLTHLVGEPRGAIMRAVLDPFRGQSLATKHVRIPPGTPFSERLEALSAYLVERRSRSTDTGVSV